MKSLSYFISILLAGFLFACQDNMNLGHDSGSFSSINSISIDNGAKVAILSDIHVMAPSLLVKDGPAFQAYLAQDPKLLEYSAQILDVTINKLINQRPDLVLISGDLTKDGEIISHELVASMLRKLTLNGIKVLVTVGNHDINNPEAVRYINDKTVRVPTVQTDKIPNIYAKFGFDNAISNDPNSLSYVNEPIKGLWVITIDENKYY